MIEPKAPLIVGLQVTGRCNLSCTYCYAHDLDAIDMPLAAAKQLLCELRDEQVFQVIIEGGEPFLHPNIRELVAFGLTLFPDLAVLTNGTLLDDDLCSWLSSTSLNYPALSVQVSIDSHIAEINDRTRGQGAIVLDGINKLVDAGVEVAIATVVQRNNIDSVHHMINSFHPRIRRFHLMDMMPTKSNVSRIDGATVGREELQRFWAQLADSGVPSEICISHPHDEINRSLGPSTICANNCLGGVIRAYVTPDLDLLACNIATHAVLGSLKKMSFRDAWFSEEAESIRRCAHPPCSDIASCL
jgi:MoaA/NifB/PqqE/SkfB family radical SAM enzyme